jgi:hypothetical protein
LPRKEIETPGAAIFGSEAMVNILRALMQKEGNWVQQADLARLAEVDERTVQRLMQRLLNQVGKSNSFEDNKPFKNVKLYRINPSSNLSKGLKLIFEELEK